MPATPRAFYQVLRLHQLVTDRMHEALAGTALTASQYTLLSLVRRLSPAIPAQLARWLRVSPQSVGEMLKVLEAQGLVKRGESAVNRRVVPMTLTPRGRRVLASTDALIAAAEERFFATLRVRERALLDRSVQRLRRAAEPPHDA